MNAGWWGATQGQADRPGGGLDGALARLRARADGDDPGISVLDAERIDAELTRLRALAEPVGLPATLATVDDVRQVCEAAGLRLRGQRTDMWEDEHVNVAASIRSGQVTIVAGDGSANWIATIEFGGPTALLWHAIQAARSTS